MRDGIIPGSPAESAAGQPRREAPAHFLLLVRPRVVDERLEDRRILPGDPFFDGSTGKILITCTLGVEDTVDRLVCEFRCDPFGTEFRCECGAAFGAVTEAVAHECGGDARVVNQAAFFEAVQTEIDPSRTKPLLTQPPSKLHTGSGPIRE